MPSMSVKPYATPRLAATSTVPVCRMTSGSAASAATAQKAIAEAVGRVAGPRTCECATALATAIITRRDLVPEQTRRELEPIVGKYLN